MIRGEGTEVVRGVTPKDVWEFVLDPAQYTKADTKIIWVTKLADTDDGMIGLEEGKFFGMRGSVVTRYRWTPDFRSINVTLIHGLLKSLNAYFEIDEVDGGTKIHHVEEMDLGRGPLGWLYDRVGGQWFADSVVQEVDEIAVERGEASQARESLHHAAEGRLDRLTCHSDPRRREVPGSRHPIGARRGRLRRAPECLVQEGRGIEDRGQLEHGRANRPGVIRMWALTRERTASRGSRWRRGWRRDSAPRENSRGGTCSARGPCPRR